MEINPSLLDEFRKPTGKGCFERDGALEPMREALRLAKTEGETIRDAVGKILGDPMKPAIANQRAARNTAFKRLETVTRSMDTARQAASDEVERIEKMTAAPKAPVAAFEVSMVAQVREKLAAMTFDQRAAAVRDGIAHGDPIIVAAALLGPPMLAGTTREVQEAWRADWRRRAFPTEHARAAMLQRALSRFDGAGERLLRWAASLTDADEIRRAEELEKQAKEAADAA